MNQFFTDLAASMADRQEMRLNITKIGEDLVILAVPNFKDEGKHITISGSPAELDAGFITEMEKPLKVAAGKIVSNAEEVAAEMEEEQEDYDKSAKKSDKKADKKPATKSKPEAKPKAPAKKTEEKPKPEAKPKADPEPKKTEVVEEKKEKTGVAEVVGSVKAEKVKEDNISAEEKAFMEDGKKNTPAPVEEVRELARTVVEHIEEEQVNESPVEEEKTGEDEGGPDNEELFKYFMEEGKKLFDARKFEEAEKAYQSAVELKPDDKKAKGDLDQATKWVKAINKLYNK